MTLPLPAIDDITFDELIAEARGLIPRFAPEWTDHNAHDPGIMLLELMAWIAEQQIFGAGTLGDEYTRAFAKLMGVEPEPASPATGVVWPNLDAVTSDADAVGVSLRAGARVVCLEKREIDFQVAHDVYITPARIRSPHVAGASPRGLRVGATHAAGADLLPRRAIAGEIEVEFDRYPLADPETRAPIAIGIDLEAGETAEAAAPELRGQLTASYRTPGEPWAFLEIAEDGTHALNRSGVVLLRLPPRAGASSAQIRINTENRVNPSPPRVRRVVPNAITTRQTTEHAPAALSRTAPGVPSEGIQLDLTGATDYGSLDTLDVSSRGRTERWTRVPDLANQTPDSQAFEVHWDRNTIVFGNGVNGRTVPRDAEVRHPRYRTTLGAAGNLAAGRRWRLPSLPGEHEVFGRNQAPLRGGRDAWGTSDVREAFRSRARKVRTLLRDEQLVRAVLELPGLHAHRVEVLTSVHPAAPGVAASGSRTVVVIPRRGRDVESAQDHRDSYASAVAAALEPGRVLGERLSVITPERVPISVEAEVLLDGWADEADTCAHAAGVIEARLSDVGDTDHPDIEPWPVGRAVTRRELVCMIGSIGGVRAVLKCRIARDGGPVADSDVVLAPFEIAIGRATVRKGARP